MVTVDSFILGTQATPTVRSRSSLPLHKRDAALAVGHLLLEGLHLLRRDQPRRAVAGHSGVAVRAQALGPALEVRLKPNTKGISSAAQANKPRLSTRGVRV